MKPIKCRATLIGAALLWNGLACDDLVVGRGWSTDAQTSTGTWTGAAGATALSPIASGPATSGASGLGGQALAGAAQGTPTSTGGANARLTSSTSAQGGQSAPTSPRSSAGGAQGHPTSTSAVFAQGGAGASSSHPGSTVFAQGSAGATSGHPGGAGATSTSASGGHTSVDTWTGGTAAQAGSAANTTAGCPIGIPVHPSTPPCSGSGVPVMGDVNCSGAVDINDALILGRHIENLEEYPLIYEPAGDLNCDGCLTTDDATLIAAVSAGSFVAHDCAN